MNHVVGITGTVKRRSSASSCLLVPRIFHGFSKVGVRAIVRIAKGCDPGVEPLLDAFLLWTGFGEPVGFHPLRVMSNTVATDFMTVVDQCF